MDGPETREIISDSIYANSSTLDGRRFADEFLRRKKGDSSAPFSKAHKNGDHANGSGNLNSGNHAGGWNEVAKTNRNNLTSSAGQDWNSAFKVVQGKKGKKKT